MFVPIHSLRSLSSRYPFLAYLPELPLTNFAAENPLGFLAPPIEFQMMVIDIVAEKERPNANLAEKTSTLSLEISR